MLDLTTGLSDFLLLFELTGWDFSTFLLSSDLTFLLPFLLSSVLSTSLPITTLPFLPPPLLPPLVWAEPEGEGECEG